MTLDLTLHTAPSVPLEAEVITPARLAGLSPADAARLTVVHGNQSAELGEFFRVESAAGAGRSFDLNALRTSRRAAIVRTRDASCSLHSNGYLTM